MEHQTPSTPPTDSSNVIVNMLASGGDVDHQNEAEHTDHSSVRWSEHQCNNRVHLYENVVQSDRTEPESSKNLSNVTVHAPKFVLFVFTLHGIGALLPWNMLIDAVSYFEYKINASDTILTEQNDTNIKENLFSYISIASKTPNILLQVLNIVFTISRNASGQSNSRSKRFAYCALLGKLSIRIQISLFMQIAVFLALVAFALYDTSHWSPETVFAVIMLCTITINMANGVYQSCIYGSAARIPVLKYTNAITLGMSLSGTVTSLLDIGSIALSPSPKTDIVVFFSIAACIMLLCLVAEFSYNRWFAIDMTDEDGLENCSDRQDLVPDETVQTETPTSWQLYWATIRDIWPHLVNILLVYGVTFSLFPAVVANIRPEGDNSSDGGLVTSPYFTAVACFLCFNLFTTVGNFLAERFPLVNSAKLIGSLALARLILVPFFLLCNYLPPTAHRYRLPVLVSSDWLFVYGVVVLALTAGYLSSLCMMYAPVSVRADPHRSQQQQQQHTTRRAETAGMMAALTVILGILFGVDSSLIYPQLI